MSRGEESLPKKRRKFLVVERLPGEILVYDWVRHKAVCLNQTSSLIWEHCNGRTTVDEMIQILERELDVQADEAVVRYGVQKLRESHLLYQAEVNGESGLTRRELIGKVAVASIPVVVSLAVPEASEAITLISKAACESKLPPDPECQGTTRCKTPGTQYCCPQHQHPTRNCLCNNNTSKNCRCAPSPPPGAGAC